jgi:hypothetical protein
MDEEIQYTDGHKCIPNGVGDYTFVCPTKGEKPGFVPFMLRRMVKGKCACGTYVEVLEDGN